MSQTEHIKIYDDVALQKMRSACTLARETLFVAEKAIAQGVTTLEINDICHDFILSNGAIPAPLNYKGFPKSVCTSVNHVVCHGIPNSKQVLKDGDIINVDVTVIVDGFYGDTSATFIVGNCSNHARQLVEAARNAMWHGISAVRPFGYFREIGDAIQKYINTTGFSIVKDYCGHGIGDSFHLAPQVMHHGNNGMEEQILPGMFFTIEPMINAGSYKVKLAKDGWTVETIDKALSAQFEHTIAVLDNGVEILTR